MTRSMPTRSILLVLAAAAVSAGCGEADPTLDERRVEREIRQGVMAELQVDLDVECPSGRPLERGDRFTCSASSDDTDDLEVRVRQTNGRGSVRWDARILATDRYETSIAQSIEQQRRIKVEITCPDVVPIEEGGSFTCEARDPKTGETRDVEVVQKDEEGNITFSS